MLVKIIKQLINILYNYQGIFIKLFERIIVKIILFIGFITLPLLLMYSRTNFKQALRKFLYSLFSKLANYFEEGSVKTIEDNTPKVNKEPRLVKDVNGRFIRILFDNEYCLTSNDLIKLTYEYLLNYTPYLEFGYKKVIIPYALLDEQVYTIHHNILLNNDTSFEDYYEQVKFHISDKASKWSGLKNNLPIKLSKFTNSTISVVLPILPSSLGQLAGNREREV